MEVADPAAEYHEEQFQQMKQSQHLRAQGTGGFKISWGRCMHVGRGGYYSREFIGRFGERAREEFQLVKQSQHLKTRQGRL
jgi:hypothetical protein